MRHFLIALLPQLATMPPGSAPDADSTGDWRTIEFETARVTAPDVAVSPDGEWLVLTMLGKLFRLPVAGGEAEQLTFGPYYDASPAVSPDGRAVAFHSDRDGSEGNIFLLDLATREVRQLTREPWADRPAWAPDGQSIVYLRLERDAWTTGYDMPRPPATVRRSTLGGGAAETVRPPGPIWSVFHLADGRLAWTRLERDSISGRVGTRVETGAPNGTVVLLGSLDGVADPVVASPAGDGLYARWIRYDESPTRTADLFFVPWDGTPERRVLPVSGERAGFAVDRTNGALYLGNRGHLWKVQLPGGRRAGIPFRARPSVVVREPVPPPPWAPLEPGASGRFRTIEQLRLSPDGSRLFFQMAGRIWQQMLPDGMAQPLFDRPGAVSPDRRWIAVLRDAPGGAALDIVDLSSGTTRTAEPRGDCGYHQPSWGGDLLVAATACDHQIVALDPRTGSAHVLAQGTANWEPFPHLSADGRTVYFAARYPGTHPALYAVRLDRPESRSPVAPSSRNGVPMVVHGDWLAEGVDRRGIRLTRLARGGHTPASTRIVEGADGHAFAFVPERAGPPGLLYAAGDTVWREPLAGGTREPIPIRLELRAPVPPPVLIRSVRLLDFAAGRFGAEVSLLVERGRIRWIGRGSPPVLAAATRVVDAEGRFAIPGLFDMHFHGPGCGGVVQIAHGVTSGRNMGGRIQPNNAAADHGDFSGDPVPRCFYTGMHFEGAAGNPGGRFVPEDEDDLRAQVRMLHARGARFIKIFNRLPWPLQRAAADEGRRLGLPVVAHGLSLEQAVKGVTLGFAGLTHWGSGWPHWWSVTTIFYDDVQQLFAAAGTRWEPTLGLAVAAGDEIAFRDDPHRFRRANLSNWGLPDDVLQGMWVERLRTMRAAYGHGVRFMPGTDRAPGGLALHWEMQHYVEAGIPPVDVLHLATQAAAEDLGAGTHLGTLEVNKVADLILLDANPLEDIRNTLSIWRVFKGGWVFDPADLRASSGAEGNDP